MKQSAYLGLAILGSAAVLWGCGGKVDDSGSGDAGTSRGMAQSGSGGASSTMAARSGTVTETMNSGGYTYVLLDDGNEKVWVAGPECEVEVGDQVVIPSAMAMPNYHSKTLDRTFDVVYFAQAIQMQGEDGAAGGGAYGEGGMQMPPGHPSVGQDAAEDMDFSMIEKAPGGMTVAEVWGSRSDLAGEEITVRGRVVKSLSGIMDRTWFHIQDGTGMGESKDLTVTTDHPVEVGSVVLVKGTAAVDKDFGAGYFYPVILEGATVTVESEAGM